MTKNSYSAAGVDLAAAARALDAISEAVESTYDSRVLAGLGAFGGLFELTDLPERPVLVASTDGVGTKTMVAAQLDRVDVLGHDIVNHCLNDILVQGARPLFFLDYIATSRLSPELIARVVSGAAEACRAAGMPLLGGETAEMPGVYRTGELDLVGTIVGIVGRDEIIDGSAIREGDVVLALESGGPQTNGFSLARAALGGHYEDPLDPEDPEGRTVGDALLVPHRSYEQAVRPLLERGLVHGLVHVTGGGIPGNLIRVLPEGLQAEIYTTAWPEPPIFGAIRRAGEVSRQEMYDVFNMGVGFLVVLDPADVAEARALAGETLHEIGRISRGDGGVMLRFPAETDGAPAAGS